MRPPQFSLAGKRTGACRSLSRDTSLRNSHGLRESVLPARMQTTKMRTVETPASTTEARTESKIDMKERMDFLQEDLKNLFSGKGIDKSQYDDKVNFMDPITKYNSVTGYMFNIKMLKVIFSPEFQLHDIKRTGDLEATTRWTMIMKPTFNKKLGLTKFWNPTLYFTGTSIMGVNSETGKFNKHIDTWDALAPENQEFLSREGVSHVFSQLTSPLKTPDLDTPDYTLLKKKRDYEIRRYEPFIVAETSNQGSPAGKGGDAFNSLAGYLFGKNKSSEKMSMTTPVFTDNDGKMQFVLKARKDGPVRLPEPLEGNIVTRDQPGGEYAATVFNGEATDLVTEEKLGLLKQQLTKDGIAFDQQHWILARYNDPSTKARNRRNEILVPVKSFDLWES